MDALVRVCGRAYEHHHNLIDTCIPVKKDRWGNTFGFLRFVEVEDAEGFKKELKKILVDGKKVKINISLFDKDKECEMKAVVNKPITCTCYHHWGSGMGNRMLIGMPSRDLMKQKQLRELTIICKQWSRHRLVY
ncbi:hypothetical protein QVD17_11848 [Tagetes erecta]|uniref:RRM domain-containing protein n=1 Tax=Tagetes erecta TaxID=13708 RepID=A0AAD8P2E4_TARER|nr:hypothetical protein QVD17_11848 [Tagetes erecta]